MNERKEQMLCEEYLNESCVVLELGARYGTVSCVIEKTIKNGKNLVVVEPDSRVWDALEKNRNANSCSFEIVRGFVSAKPRVLENLDSHKGYGALSKEATESNIPSYTLSQIQEKSGLVFNTLVADCEGFLETFLDENIFLYNQLKIVIFEKDYPESCNYEKIQKELLKNGFIQIVSGFRECWKKSLKT
jgi:FkbM family methyltransferase